MRPMYKARLYHYLYDSKQWRSLRRCQLSSAPLCAYCLAIGITSAASIADHIRPHKGDSALFFNPDNLQSLCKACHDGHKQRQEKGGLLAGCDSQGLPLDSASHWYK